MSALRLRRVASAVAAAVAVAAALAATGPLDAAAKGALSLSPDHGVAAAFLSADYSWAHGDGCQRGDQVAFEWDPNANPPGAFIAQQAIADGDLGDCSVHGVSMQPPRDGSARPGAHVIGAEVVRSSSDGSGAGLQALRGSEKFTRYQVDADPGPGGLVPTDAPTPTPTPAPTPLATPFPLQSLNPTFAPYGCRNGIPDGTPCPGAVGGGVLALVSSPSPTAGRVAASSTRDDLGSTPKVIMAVLAAAFLLATLAIVGGWVSGSLALRRRLSRVAAATRRAGRRG